MVKQSLLSTNVSCICPYKFSINNTYVRYWHRWIFFPGVWSKGTKLHTNCPTNFKHDRKKIYQVQGISTTTYKHCSNEVVHRTTVAQLGAFLIHNPQVRGSISVGIVAILITSRRSSFSKLRFCVSVFYQDWRMFFFHIRRSLSPLLLGHMGILTYVTTKSAWTS